MNFERWGLERPVDMATLTPGALVAGRLDDEPFVGLLVNEGDVHGVVILVGGDQRPLEFIIIDAFDSLSAVDGKVIIEPLDPSRPFQSDHDVDDKALGLVMDLEGRIGLRSLALVSLSRRRYFIFDLQTGERWGDHAAALLISKWRLLVWPEGRGEPFTVAEFGS